MTKEEALKLVESKFWEKMDYKAIAKFQLFERKLCIPFPIFHEALKKSLGRPVFTHELGLNYEGLKKEFLGEQSEPTLEEIINLIPEEKRIICLIEKEKK